MDQHIARIALLVRDYDEAIAFYTEKLNFSLAEDLQLDGSKRWVIVTPPGARECSLLLAKADGKDQELHVGNQSGGRVFLFLYTDDFERDYHQMKNKGIRFLEEPRYEAYGSVAVFEDLYGNKWDLLEPKS